MSKVYHTEFEKNKGFSTLPDFVQEIVIPTDKELIQQLLPYVKEFKDFDDVTYVKFRSMIPCSWESDDTVNTLKKLLSETTFWGKYIYVQHNDVYAAFLQNGAKDIQSLDLVPYEGPTKSLDELVKNDEEGLWLIPSKCKYVYVEVFNGIKILKTSDTHALRILYPDGFHIPKNITKIELRF